MTRRPDVGALFGAAAADTFLGLPKADDLEALDAKIAILGVPCATPHRSVGPYCAGAPKAIRAAIAGYASNLHHVDFDLGGPIFPDAVTAVDAGDLALSEVAQGRVAQDARGVEREHRGGREAPTLLDFPAECPSN